MTTHKVEAFGQTIKTASESYGVLVARNRETGNVTVYGYIQNPARIAPRLRELRRRQGRWAEFDFVKIDRTKEEAR